MIVSPAEVEKAATRAMDSNAIDLEGLDREIKALEAEMDDVKKRYDKVRADLSSECVVSYECIAMKRDMAQLHDQMSTLINLRSECIVKMDNAISKMAHSKQIPKAEQIGFCEGGCVDMVVDKRSSSVVCSKCGYVLHFDLENTAENYSYRNMPQRKRNGGYRPPVHFLEVIVNLTATRQSSARDFDFILNKLGEMCDRYRIPRKARTTLIMRKFLKQLDAEEKDIIRVAVSKKMTDAQAVKEYARSKSKQGRYIRYTDYYKQCPEFAKRLSDVGPPIITGTQIDRIVAIFPLCVFAYRTSPRYLRKLANREGRKKDVPNNQSCFYLLYKICQLLDYVEFLPYIPLPKSNENIDDNDLYGWKHICGKYGWHYMPTR